MSFFKPPIILLLLIFPFAFCQEQPSGTQLSVLAEDEVELLCLSWRVAGEANNLSPWKAIPMICADYVKTYMNGRGYEMDLERVSNEAILYARSLVLNVDGMDSWVFDVDETLLSNLPYYVEHRYGMEEFNSTKFDAWVVTGMARPIEAILKLYEEVKGAGFKAFLLTGRSEKQQQITVTNLLRAGFRDWDMLILRSSDDQGKTATTYKSEKRNELVGKGYRILGNVGDQWSDLSGSALATRSFKLPNPMYFIS